MGQVWSFRLIEACYQLANIIKSVSLRVLRFCGETTCNGERPTLPSSYRPNNIRAPFFWIAILLQSTDRSKRIRRMQRARQLPIALVDLAIFNSSSRCFEIGKSERVDRLG